MEAVEDAIHDKIAGVSGITALVGTRIYFGTAPAGATYPFVTFAFSGGGEDRETPQHRKNLVYLVQGVSQISKSQANTLAELLETAFDEATLTISGWTNIWTAVEEHLPAFEMDTQTGKQTWRAGRYVRIRLSQ
ncbi:MAG TPA: DUF3168 domain-containing protein [Anaerolineales bacterium]|nr:DUF3168 domain-containing protein [Anaerolineales bacterium]